MNERIKLLAKQAAAIDGWGVEVWQTTFTEKFAELIVRECCSKLEEMGEGWHEFAMNPPQGQAPNAHCAMFAAYRLKEDAVYEIKELFGVGE